MVTRRGFLKMGLAAGVGTVLAGRIGGAPRAFADAPAAVRARARAIVSPQVPLPGKNIPQFVDPLPGFGPALGQTPGLEPIFDDGTEIHLTIHEFKTNMMPSTFLPGTYTGTWTWGYHTDGQVTAGGPYPTYLGPVVVATRDTPTKLRFTNKLGTAGTTNVLAYKYSTDKTLHWADPLNNSMNMCAHMPGPEPSIDCADIYRGPIPAAVHLHGGEVPPELDGGPDSWFTNFTDEEETTALHGGGYYSRAGAAANEVILTYPNQQDGGFIWFHDHTLGATRLNVYAGLAGGYVLVDEAEKYTNPFNWGMPFSPLVIQDRMFDTQGQLYFPAGNPWIPNPDHPQWVPEFIGDTICVNGKVWPYLNVEPKRYAFYVVNGSNARSYEMFLTNQVTKVDGPVIWQVGTDGGLLDTPVKIDPSTKVLPRLVMMPGERAILIIDFTGQPVGTKLLLRNVARAPYPGGATPDGSTTGRIMQFRVVASTGPDTSWNPAAPSDSLRTKPIKRLVNAGALGAGVTAAKTRRLTLNEVMGMPTILNGTAYPGGPLEILVNNTKWSGEHITGMNDGMAMMEPDVNLPQGITDKLGNVISEFPLEGTTEIWEFVNLTADAHPMHTHLTQFQLLSRQNFDVGKYMAAYGLAFPGGGYDMMTGAAYPKGVYIPGFGPPLPYDTGGNVVGGNPDVTPFLKGAIKLPNANELGWKDTILTPPGMVTRIAVRFAPMDKEIDGSDGLYFPFDPSGASEEGNYSYVWHCHIVDHEDNEMMRPHRLQPAADVIRTYVRGENY